MIEAFSFFHSQRPLLALPYQGYQFGQYNPQLGDGRGFLYGQVRGVDGELYDFGTKGSGRTPYSRTADGRLTLKGGVREVLAAEALHQLGVRTSRCLSLIETGESLWRMDEPSPTRSCQAEEERRERERLVAELNERLAREARERSEAEATRQELESRIEALNKARRKLRPPGKNRTIQ